MCTLLQDPHVIDNPYGLTVRGALSPDEYKRFTWICDFYGDNGPQGAISDDLADTNKRLARASGVTLFATLVTCAFLVPFVFVDSLYSYFFLIPPAALLGWSGFTIKRCSIPGPSRRRSATAAEDMVFIAYIERKYLCQLSSLHTDGVHRLSVSFVLACSIHFWRAAFCA